jgi:guanine nucleotide-binding protein G(i) subunit alpha
LLVDVCVRVSVCLFVGAGQSGKSTVAKQMKIIHMDGFSEEERASYTSVICSNIVVSMRSILFAAQEFSIKTSKSNKVRFF